MSAVSGLLYLPVVVWVATGMGLLVAYRKSTPRLVLRLAATFLALWAILATTVLVWVLLNGGMPAVLVLLHSPLLLFQSRWALVWVAGAVGALGVFTVAFLLNQLVGRGLLRVLDTSPVPWPSELPAPAAPTWLLSFESPVAEAFSFTLLEPGFREGRTPYRRDVILLSRGLRALLTAEEIDAVVAHELGHIRGLDSRYLTFLRTLARMMRWDPLLAYLAWSLTRREEYRADIEAARMTRRPLALARALFKAASAPESAPARPVPGFLGMPGRRGHREAYERIRRLVALAESGAFEGEPVV
ncbi:MAG: M48 family metalloprotease [Thermoplasmata archaeon]|nr:M48 family metalloprotease [Thermoplasmata archaeon]